jgi:hypothetical protein
VLGSNSFLFFAGDNNSINAQMSIENQFAFPKLDKCRATLMMERTMLYAPTLAFIKSQKILTNVQKDQAKVIKSK